MVGRLVVVGDTEEVHPALPAERLSVPERQLVEIARAVARDARIVLLDEPTAALSDDDIERVRAVVARLSQEGRSVVNITHRLGEIFDMAQRVTVLRDGESQPPVKVSSMTTGRLIEQMLGRPLDELFPARSSNVGALMLDVVGLQSDGLVSPVDLNVRAGEILGLAGQLGSGAASVLRTLGGAQPLRAGRVTLGGAACKLGSPRRAQREGLAYCSGDRKLDGFFGGRSVEENLSSPALNFVTPGGWVSRKRERQRASDLAAVVQFDQRWLQHSMSTLSGGNQQQIVLGKWLGMRPRVLLVEEPTRGVDVGARAEIYRRLRRFAAEGLAIVFASSDTLEVQGVADRALTFVRGRQVGQYQAAAVDQQQLVRDITHPLERVG